MDPGSIKWRSRLGYLGILPFSPQLPQSIDFKMRPTLFNAHIHVHTDALSHTQTSDNMQITVSHEDLLRWGVWTNKEVATDGLAPLLTRDTNEICQY